MQKQIQVGIIGDFSGTMYTHKALNDAVEHCRARLKFVLQAPWIPTTSVTDEFLTQHAFQGFWIAPGSPYKNDEGVYKLIRWARENNFPLFGTCGGFQYMLIEYARNVLGFAHADHEETASEADQLVISKLSCSLKGQDEEIAITDTTSWLHQVAGKPKITGKFYCSYGVNPRYQTILNQYPMIFTAFAPSGEPRAFELKTHRFFKGTLFQPSLDSSVEKPNALMLSFFSHCLLE
jgi:CTP synthase (UTP-ammonia lyase)